MKTWLINRVRNWSKSSEARPHRGTRLMEPGTGAEAGVEGGRASWGGGLVGTHSTSLWSLDRQHLPHTKTWVPKVYKIFLKYCFWLPLWKFHQKSLPGTTATERKSQVKMVTTNWLWESLAMGRLPPWVGKSFSLLGLQVHVWVYFGGGWSELVEWWLYFLLKLFINLKVYLLDFLFKLKLSDIQKKLVVKKWNTVSKIQFIPAGMKNCKQESQSYTMHMSLYILHLKW